MRVNLCKVRGGILLELVHPQSVQSQITQTTPYTVITHAHGRYPVIAGDTFYHNGLGIRPSSSLNAPAYAHHRLVDTRYQ
jgi:hypothetical protein